MKTFYLKLLNKRFLILIGVAIIILLFMGIFVFKKAPIPPPVLLAPPQINGKTIPTQTTLQTNGSFPKKLPVYRGEGGSFSEDQAVKIAQEFGFITSPQRSEGFPLGKTLSWATDKNFLDVGLDSPTIDYSLNLFALRSPTEEGSLPNTNQALEILNNLLAKLNLKDSLIFAPQKEEYLTPERGALIETEPQKALFIQVGLNPLLDSYPLLGRELNQPNALLILGKNEQVTRFYYERYYSSFLKLEDYPLKSREQILKSLQKEGKIVSFGSMSEETWPLADFISAQFDQVSLGYFQPSNKEELIQPVYILSGTGILTDRQTTTITAYLPAIAYSP